LRGFLFVEKDMKKTFLKHTLLEAMAGLSVVEMHVLPFLAYEKVFIAHSDDQDKLVEQVIIATTGLTQLQLDELTTLDFNTLENASLEQVNHSSEYFFDLLGKEFNAAEPMLFDPLDDAEKITYVIPKVKTYKIMKSIENTDKAPYAQARYITQACTGLEDNQIDMLSVRDWNMLQVRINDFLQRDAGYLTKSQ
jgi:hypothetical protein